MKFANIHNDYLDPDRYNIDSGEDQPDPPQMAWVLYRLEDGEQTAIGIFHHPDGQDVMGCDMHEWMTENDYYGPHSPDDYHWEGDTESVAIMAVSTGMPDFRFVWEEI